MKRLTIPLCLLLLRSVCAATKTIASSSRASSSNDRDAKYQADPTSSGIISTAAGVFGTSPAAEKLAIGKRILDPQGIILDKENNLFIACYLDNMIYKVTASSGIITTVAGTGVASYSGDGDQATSATLHRPRGIALDTAGNIFIADTGNSRIRKVTVSTGVITTLAGDGKDSGEEVKDNVAATSISLSNPRDVAVDASGNIFIADTGHQRIRKVAASTGMITTIAGTGNFADKEQKSTSATEYYLPTPYGVTLDTSGNVFIADISCDCIFKVTVSTGVISIVAGTGVGGELSGGYNGDDILATAAKLNYPTKVAIDASGNMFIADSNNYRIRKVTASTGIISTVAGTGTLGTTSEGDGGSATLASLAWPYGIVVDSAGNIYFSISSFVVNLVKKVTYSDATPSAPVTPAPTLTLAPSSPVASTPTASIPSAPVVTPSTSTSTAPAPSAFSSSKAPSAPSSTATQSSSTAHMAQAFHLAMILLSSTLVLYLCRDT